MMKRLFIAAFATFMGLAGAQAAGTVFGLPLSQQLDQNGKPLTGGQLYVYKSGGTGDADLIPIFQDFGLSQAQTNPMTLDASVTGDRGVLETFFGLLDDVPAWFPIVTHTPKLGEE